MSLFLVLTYYLTGPFYRGCTMGLFRAGEDDEPRTGLGWNPASSSEEGGVSRPDGESRNRTSGFDGDKRMRFGCLSHVTPQRACHHHTGTVFG